VTSGKGGVGKSVLVSNLAVHLATLGRRVLVLDGDLSLANVDLLLGLVPKYNLNDVVEGRKRLDEIVLEGPQGIRLIPAASGIEELAELDDYRREILIRSLERLGSSADILLIDTGSGIHRQNMRLAQVADEIFVVATPEPTAFSDAYATIKVLAGRRLAATPKLLINMASDGTEARRTAERISRVSRRFLGFEAPMVGFVPRDEAVERAVRRQEPFVLSSPECAAARALGLIADWILGGTPEPEAGQRSNAGSDLRSRTEAAA